MARKSQWEKEKSEPKYSTRLVRRCRRCGRARGVFRKFQLCRICFRELSHLGEIPGVRKASW